MRKSFALVLALAGCATSEPAVPAPQLQVQVDAHKAEVTKQDLTTAEVTEELGVLAAAPGTTAVGAHWELVFDEKVIATGEQKLGTAISTSEPTIIQLVGKGATATDGPSVQKLADHHGGIPIALRGTIDFSGPNGQTAKAEFAKATNLREPRMPSVVVDVGASHYDDGHVNLTFNIGVDNPNPFPVQIAGFKYDININGQQVVKDGSAGEQVEVPTSSKKVFEVSEELTPEKFKDLDRIYKQNSMSYRMTGVLDVGLAKFDVDIGSPINFTR